MSALVMLLLPMSFTIAAVHAQSSTGGSVPAELDKPFELKVGQQAAIAPENIVIGFLNVTEDSRCPSDVVCIWQGQASIRVSAEVNGTDAGQFVLTIGANVKSATFAGGQYSVRMEALDPYPVSTSTKGNGTSEYVATLVVSSNKMSATNSAGVFVRAATADNNSSSQGDVAAVSGWDLQKGRGALVFLSREPASGMTAMTISRFTPAVAQCGNAGATECIDGHITNSKGTNGGTLHFEVLPGDRLYLAANGGEYTLDIRQIKTKPMQQEDHHNSSSNTTVTLSEGQREGPLLVQEIGDGYVKGLNFVEYPLVRSDGFPVTLHLGDTVSNGCTVTLTLLQAHQHGTAVFTKTTNYNRICPL